MTSERMMMREKHTEAVTIRAVYNLIDSRLVLLLVVVVLTS